MMNSSLNLSRVNLSKGKDLNIFLRKIDRFYKNKTKNKQKKIK